MSRQDRIDKAKDRAASVNETRTLARKANGHGVTSVQKRQAREQLVAKVGESGANRAQEDAIRSAGGRAKGLGRWIG